MSVWLGLFAAAALAGQPYDHVLDRLRTRASEACAPRDGLDRDALRSGRLTVGQLGCLEQEIRDTTGEAQLAASTDLVAALMGAGDGLRLRAAVGRHLEVLGAEDGEAARWYARDWWRRGPEHAETALHWVDAAERFGMSDDAALSELRASLVEAQGRADRAGSRTVRVRDQLPTTLLPLYAQSPADRRAQRLVYGDLYGPAASGASPSHPLLASVEVEGEGLRLTVKADAVWADAEPITAADLCFTVDALLEPENPTTGLHGPRATLRGCEVVGPDTALLRTTPDPDPWVSLAFPVLPAHVFESARIPTDHPASTEAWGSLGRRAALTEARLEVEVVRFDPGAGPWFHRVVVEPANVRSAAALIAGAVDVYIDVPSEWYAALTRVESVRLQQLQTQALWLAAVGQGGLLDDPRVRQGVRRALDRQALLAVLYPEVSPEDENPRARLAEGLFPSSSVEHRDLGLSSEPHGHALRAAGLKRARGFWSDGSTRLALGVGLSAGDAASAPALLDAVIAQLRAGGVDARAAEGDAVDLWLGRVDGPPMGERHTVAGWLDQAPIRGLGAAGELEALVEGGSLFPLWQEELWVGSSGIRRLVLVGDDPYAAFDLWLPEGAVGP